MGGGGTRRRELERRCFNPAVAIGLDVASASEQVRLKATQMMLSALLRSTMNCQFLREAKVKQGCLSDVLRESSFLAVPKPIFSNKHSFCSICSRSTSFAHFGTSPNRHNKSNAFVKLNGKFAILIQYYFNKTWQTVGNFSALRQSYAHF